VIPGAAALMFLKRIRDSLVLIQVSEETALKVAYVSARMQGTLHMQSDAVNEKVLDIAPLGPVRQTQKMSRSKSLERLIFVTSVFMVETGESRTHG
jgi:hypothetical protein